MTSWKYKRSLALQNINIYGNIYIMTEKSPSEILTEALVDQTVTAVGAENITTILSEVTGEDTGLDTKQQLHAIDVLAGDPSIDIDLNEARLIKRGLVIYRANLEFRQSRRRDHHRPLR